MTLATQNPIEQEGTYPLPEAQLDRFLLKILVGYPSLEEETRIVALVTSVASAISSTSRPCSASRAWPRCSICSASCRA
jgi:MoxR-like ATPase